ncbi:reverse transcriptase domain-containing protein [Tanacetum coccineum]
MERPEEESPDEPKTEPEELPEPWTLFIDESSCIDGSGAGLILTNSEGVEFTYAMRFRFEATNNEAEYEALRAGLRIAEQMGVKNLQANVDSQLVANKVNGSYVAKESGMVQYLEKEENFSPITSPWPLYKWGSTIGGPFPDDPGKLVFDCSIDYLLPWIEESCRTITGNQSEDIHMGNNIVCQIRTTREIVSDNGK